MSIESVMQQIGKAGVKELSESVSNIKETGPKWDGALPSKEYTRDGWDGSLPKEQKQKTAWDGSLPEAIKEGPYGVTRGIENFHEGIDKESPSGKIYNDAGVNIDNPEKKLLRGKEYDVYKIDIDPQLEGPDGITNQKRMSEGNAAYVDRDGKLTKVDFHHHEQKDQGPLVELDKDTHKNNEAVLHPGQGRSEGRGIDTQWDARRQEYWQQRAEEFKYKVA
jgi:hypothetical protein